MLVKFDNKFLKIPEGFSDEKDSEDYWLDAVRDFWSETGSDNDAIDLRETINWFDNKRKSFKQI